MNIAFIGVGNMGRPMLANLLKKGFSATAYDIVPAALEGAVALGAARAGSPAEAAAAGDMLITILPSSGNVEAAYLGAGGILEGIARGKLCVDMSTIDPGTSQRVAARLAEKGIRFIDAPVSGGVGGATAGTLAIMVGGAAGDFEEAKPALDAMGSNIIHVGAVGAGEVAKLCNNLIAGAAFVAVSEAFRIAEAFGVDPKILTAVIAKSSGATWSWKRTTRSPASTPPAPPTAITRRDPRSIRHLRSRSIPPVGTSPPAAIRSRRSASVCRKTSRPSSSWRRAIPASKRRARSGS